MATKENERLTAEVEKLTDNVVGLNREIDRLRDFENDARELRIKFALVQKMNADNAKMRTAYLDEKTAALIRVSELQKKLSSILEAVCRECSGEGEIGLSDGEVPCPTCGGSGDPTNPGVFAQNPILKPGKIEGCLVCGGRLSVIRGKFPGQPDREVCPTCATEKLEDIESQKDMAAQKPVENLQPGEEAAVDDVDDLSHSGGLNS